MGLRPKHYECVSSIAAKISQSAVTWVKESKKAYSVFGESLKEKYPILRQVTRTLGLKIAAEKPPDRVAYLTRLVESFLVTLYHCAKSLYVEDRTCRATYMDSSHCDGGGGGSNRDGNGNGKDTGAVEKVRILALQAQQSLHSFAMLSGGLIPIHVCQHPKRNV